MSAREQTSNAIKQSFFRTMPTSNLIVQVGCPPCANPGSCRANGACLTAAARIQGLVQALQPFVEAYERKADHIGDSDLDNEQPRYVDVTLGDCRKAARLLARLA